MSARQSWLSFVVLGAPQGARRHRVDTRSGRVRTYHGDDHEAAEAAVVRAAAAAMVANGWVERYDGPVSVGITTTHRRPKRLCRKMDRATGLRPYVGKPDADNIAKLILDGITKAGVWTDDTRVASLVVTRWYARLHLDGSQDREQVDVTIMQL